MIDATAIALIDEELEYSEDLHEAYGEMYAEYRSEMGRYGDAWPGSCDMISGMEAELDELDQLGALYRAISPPLRTTVAEWNHPLIEEPF